MDSWLVIGVLKHWALRMDNTKRMPFALAEWLKTQPKVTKVLFPGLPEHPGYEINKAQNDWLWWHVVL